MKQLFWKECYELRFLPLGAALAVAALLVGLKAYTHLLHDSYPTSEALIPVLIGIWLLFAALTGSGTIAQEIGTGTLQFLSSLPVSRRTLWWVKAGAAFGMLLPSLLTSTLTWLLCCEAWGTGKAITNPIGVEFFLGYALPILLGVFAIALAVSPFFDRSLSAFVVSILFVWGIAALFISLTNQISPYHPEYLLYTLVGLSILTFAAISYWTFTRGETLRGSRRFIVAGITGGVCLGISLLILATASALGAWQPRP
jgi:ABC-type transport system involved in multi-copper enzyme maturation permease subunit